MEGREIVNPALHHGPLIYLLNLKCWKLEDQHFHFVFGYGIWELAKLSSSEYEKLPRHIALSTAFLVFSLYLILKIHSLLITNMRST